MRDEIQQPSTGSQLLHRSIILLRHYEQIRSLLWVPIIQVQYLPISRSCGDRWSTLLWLSCWQQRKEIYSQIMLESIHRWYYNLLLSWWTWIVLLWILHGVICTLLNHEHISRPYQWNNNWRYQVICCGWNLPSVGVRKSRLCWLILPDRTLEVYDVHYWDSTSISDELAMERLLRVTSLLLPNK